MARSSSSQSWAYPAPSSRIVGQSWYGLLGIPCRRSLLQGSFGSRNLWWLLCFLTLPVGSRSMRHLWACSLWIDRKLPFCVVEVVFFMACLVIGQEWLEWVNDRQLLVEERPFWASRDRVHLNRFMPARLSANLYPSILNHTPSAIWRSFHFHVHHPTPCVSALSVLLVSSPSDSNFSFVYWVYEPQALSAN